jgi:hypothetical protein
MRVGSAVRVRRVDPGDFVEPAAAILQESWQPPVLRYRGAYLAWQFAFPTGLPPLAVAAFDGEEPVGFAGATSRRVRVGGQALVVYLVSFVAVRPAWRGRHLTGDLYRELLQVIREHGTPVVTFAEGGARGQRCLLRAYADGGFDLCPLGSCAVYGYCRLPGALPASPPVHEERDPATLVRTLSACGGGDVLWSAPDLAQLGHYFGDPRPRTCLVARGSSGAEAAAWAVRTEVVTASGIDHVTTLDCVHWDGCDGELLRALLDGAARRWPGRDGGGVVTAANLSWVEPAALRACGLRLTRTCYACYLAVPPLGGGPWAAARTNLEVV